MGKHSFLFLGANSPWTYGLAEAIAQKYATHAVQFYDWRTYSAQRATWPQQTPPPLLHRSIHTFPTGYAGSLEWAFRFYIQRLIHQWCKDLKQRSGQFPWIITPHPDYAPWVRKIPSQKLIYYNFDNYVLYRPDRKQKILDQEQALIEQAILTLCASREQLQTLQHRLPSKASSIHHYPHGFIETCLNSHPQNPPKSKTVGYVGTLGDRLDWSLIYQVITACPEITFIFVGGIDEQNMIEQGDWRATRQSVLALPNVEHIGLVPSAQVAIYYWSFAINWIPYLVDHPFNQASCPTKIMDGIASGRPIISTNLPECRLYPDWIHIFRGVEDAITLIRQQLLLADQPTAYSTCTKQLAFARQHTWRSRVRTLEKLLLAAT